MICLPTEHQNSFKIPVHSRIELELLVFEERKNQRTQRKTSRSRAENQQQTQPTYDVRDPFLGRPGNLTGPKSEFEIKVSGKVEFVLTFNEVHFVSLANNLTV